MKAPRLKVLALFDAREDLPRGHDFSAQFCEESWRSESQVVRALKSRGHEVRMLALRKDLEALIEEARDFAPDAAFNMMEEFRGDSNLVPTVLGMLETLGVPYTGAGPAALLLCKDKALAKDLLSMRKVPTPPHWLAPKGRRVNRPADLTFPLIVKPRMEDASYGISAASVVQSDSELARQIRSIHQARGQDAIVEAYVEGRELYCGLMGEEQLRAFPLREVRFGRLSASGKAVAGFRVKWDKGYRKRHGIVYGAALDLPEAVTVQAQAAAIEACRALHVGGYARVDLRLNAQGNPFVLEVNPNPDLSRDGEFALGARAAGIKYEDLIEALARDARFSVRPRLFATRTRPASRRHSCVRSSRLAGEGRRPATERF